MQIPVHMRIAQACTDNPGKYVTFATQTKVHTLRILRELKEQGLIATAYKEGGYYIITTIKKGTTQ